MKLEFYEKWQGGDIYLFIFIFLRLVLLRRALLWPSKVYISSTNTNYNYIIFSSIGVWTPVPWRRVDSKQMLYPLDHDAPHRRINCLDKQRVVWTIMKKHVFAHHFCSIGFETDWCHIIFRCSSHLLWVLSQSWAIVISLLGKSARCFLEGAESISK